MSIAETFMQAVLTTLQTAMPTITVVRDDPYLDEVDTTEKLNITQGDDVLLGSNLKYTDSEMTFNIDIFAVQRTTATPLGTLVNNRRSLVVQALPPTLNGSIALGVTGASQLTEGDTFAPAVEHADRPTADARMVWTVQIRRDVDNPDTLTP